MRRSKGRLSSQEWTWRFGETPVGPLILYFSPAGLTALEFADETAKTRIPETSLPVAIKAMVKLLGLPGGDPRPPLPTVSGDRLKALEAVIDRFRLRSRYTLG